MREAGRAGALVTLAATGLFEFIEQEPPGRFAKRLGARLVIAELGTLLASTEVEGARVFLFAARGNTGTDRCVETKAHVKLRAEDVLTYTWSSEVRVWRVAELGKRRGPADEARELYKDLSPGL